jgi:hypothetical protein
MGQHTITTTRNWAVCDKCGEKSEDIREDLLPVKWAKIFVEPAPDEYPTDDMRSPIPHKWANLIRPDLRLVFCEQCYKEFQYLFVRKMGK